MLVRPTALAAAVLTAVSLARAAAPATQPNPPAWMAKPPATWPQIHLTNKIVDPANRVGYSGSAGLARLPNNVVVLLTAGHLLGGAKPADFGTAFKSWTAVVPPGMAAGVRMKSVAMDTAKPLDLDALVLMPFAQQPTWPVTVLPIRETPLEVGETVYLIAIPVEKGGRQTVRKGEVTAVHDDHKVDYSVEGKFVTTGNSGAPVIDSHGRFAGINTAHLNNQDDPAHMKLVLADASAVLGEMVMPPGTKPLVLAAKPAAAAGTPPATGPASEADEKAALDLYMAAAKQIMAGDERGGRTKIEALIKQYPNTTAAAKARTLFQKR